MTKTGTTFTLLEGAETALQVYGKPYTLRDALHVAAE
jgi:hypothetical protein